ncbi:MAG TPA: hydantoinase B/oxoprolinase family protein [Anaerolineales bacterium]|nr:hydantoinase B/oxoprolinase family protein [Anaerolineales bacterium]
MPELDSVSLEVFKHLFASIAEEMGVVLRRTGFSPNIKERRDFSCALFDAHGQMIAQAAHIPVHLGAMPLSVQACLQAVSFQAGDVTILNDPFLGGTHLPDITLVSPIFTGKQLLGFVASRAHHADIGGISPGSMPLSNEIFQEGIRIPPIKLVEAGTLREEILSLILANVRTPAERRGDLNAQLAANHVGVTRLLALAERYQPAMVAYAMQGLLAYSKKMMLALLARLPAGEYPFQDVLDEDAPNGSPVPLRVRIQISAEQALIDFSGSAPQQTGNINATYAITLSAVYYAFRCLLDEQVPTNSGLMSPLQVIAPLGSIVNAVAPAAVAAGNVETSQRITDVLLGALAQALPSQIPAASQGTMNNLTIGGWDPHNQRAFAYYETTGGGCGASALGGGESALQVHMTNTLNTPIEALEYAYPFRVKRYAMRENSGGAGLQTGGNGIIREIELLTPAQVTLLSERRKFAPYGLAGGSAGKSGENWLIRQGYYTQLPAKHSFWAESGDIIGVHTPGGGGWGVQSKKENET